MLYEVITLSRVTMKRIKDLEDYVLRDKLLETYRKSVFWDTIVGCYLNFDFVKYYDIYGHYFDKKEIEDVKTLINGLPEGLSELKTYCLKYLIVEYLVQKLDDEQLKEIKNHFKNRITSYNVCYTKLLRILE